MKKRIASNVDNQEVLSLGKTVEGVFLKRPNRFLAMVEIPGAGRGKECEVHVHDPGRLKELLVPGAKVLVKKVEDKGGKRKTKWDMLAAWYGDEKKDGGMWVLVHSGYHRAISEWVLRGVASPFGGVDEIKPEVQVGHSRLDFVLTEKGVMLGVEVKGCSLARDGIALFPDAPTERGRKHLETLMGMKKEGLRAALLILVFRRDAECFYPNSERDPKFAKTFWDAVEIGVEVYPLKFSLEKGKIWYLGRIPVCGSI